MEIPEGLQKRKEFEARVITRTLADDDFRAELEEDPVAAIGKEMGTPLPEGVRVEILHEEPGTLILVLPRKAARPHVDEALSDEALGGVAGAGEGQDPNPLPNINVI